MCDEGWVFAKCGLYCINGYRLFVVSSSKSCLLVTTFCLDTKQTTILVLKRVSLDVKVGVNLVTIIIIIIVCHRYISVSATGSDLEFIRT